MSAEPVERPVGEIDLVAEPIRYPRSPLIALIVIAVIPTIGLFLLQRWADGEADDYEATRAAVASIEGTPPDPGLFAPDLRGGVDADGDGRRDDRPDDDGPDDGDAPDETAPADDADVTDDDRVIGGGRTAIFDYRRTPTVVASVASARRLGAEVAPVFSFLDERSCGALSVAGVPVTSVNPDLPVIPASNQKLLVAAAALEVLGPDHRFTTSVAVPPPVDGVVDGDIFLIGGGDPLLGSDDYPLDDDVEPVVPPTSLDVLADAVVAAGVSRIRGTVIGDGTRYDDEFFVESWADGVAGVEAGPVDALLVNDARVLGRSNRESDPNAGAAREFVRLLRDRGVRVDNGWGSGVASTLVPVVGTVESVPLDQIVTEMLLTSDNNTAEMLLKEIGVAGAGTGARIAGAQVVTDTLESMGLPVEGVVVVDGSGLSNDNRVTCALILGILQRSVDGPIPDALPIAGQTGTLVDEFVDSPMTGRLRAKTGTLNNEPFDTDPPAVKALAGYVTTPDEPTIEFVMIANAGDISLENRYRPLWSAFAGRVATFPAGPSADDLGPR